VHAGEANPGPEIEAASPVSRLTWTAHLALRRVSESRFPFRPPPAIERAQRRRVGGIVRHAYRHVPYYRETMDRLGLRPDGIRTAADLGRLPLIDREQLQRDPLHFVSRARPLDRYLKMQTGGSSGAPITYFRDALRLRGIGHHERRHAVERRLTGRRWRARILDITSPLSPAVAIRRAVSGRLLVPAWARMEGRELSLLDPPQQALAVMNEYRPDMVISYGSYLEALFQHAHHSGADFHRPAVAVYHSDALSDAARGLLCERLGISVLTYYSAVEAPAIGFECEEHLGLHLNRDLYPVRIVDPDGEELPDGRSGEVVVSNLVNRGTVLLNYWLGDVASKLTRSDCPCGRSLPLLSFLEGRVADWVSTQSGDRMHPQGVRTLFTDEEEVWRYQVVQRSLSHFALTLVTSPSCDRRRLQARLADKFARRLGQRTTIEVAFADSLPRSRRGKVRTVVGLPPDQTPDRPRIAVT
jgi:phenylacetate-CoA ligase